MVVIEIPDTLIVESFTKLKEEYHNHKQQIQDLRKSILDDEIKSDKLTTSTNELIEDFKLHINTNIDNMNEFDLENHYDIQDKIYKEIKQDKTNIDELESVIISNRELLEKELTNNKIEIQYLYNMLFLIKDYIKDENNIEKISFLNYNLTNFINLIDKDKDKNQKTTLIEELTDIVNNQNDSDNILLIDDIKCSLMKTSNEKHISNYINIKTLSIFSIIAIFYYYYTLTVSIMVISSVFIRDFFLYGGWWWYPFEKPQYKLCSSIELVKMNRIVAKYSNNYSLLISILSILSFIKIIYLY